LEALAVIADVLAGAAIATAGNRDPTTALTGLLEADAPVIVELVSALGTPEQTATLDSARTRAGMRLDAGRPDSAPPRAPLHWPIAFPEVFNRTRAAGFDAMVGNPPFLGGQRITGAAGTDYRNHLIAWIADDAKGSADLVAYFFLNATKVAQSFGFLATNTIAQGDTSEVGLTQIIDNEWTVHRAVSSTSWPGDTTLEIAKVWASSHPWNGSRLLDGRSVAGIDEMLYPPPALDWRKQRLAANADKSFIGSYVLGTDEFTMNPEEAQVLIGKDLRNAEVLMPFLIGEDINQSPTVKAPKWIINFHDWSKAKAQEYPDCFDIVEEKVKPKRQERKSNGEFKKRKPLPQLYWIYAEKRPKLYRTIAPLERVLAIARVSKTVQPLFLETGQVFSEKIVVFAYDDYFHFGVLTSGFHYRWAVRYSSSLRTDTNYAPSDVFDTFPQPPHSEVVEAAGEKLDEHRSELMIGRGLGLTSVYNLVHDPGLRSDEGIKRLRDLDIDLDEDIQPLRDLHVELDLAVRDAYGWSDLDLGHGFHDVRGQGVRFTFSPSAADDVLDRLLELNRKR
ncbi:MAG: restriction endonuclease, partial [bacterium]|nr:restriction endonuclease [bacterium]